MASPQSWLFVRGAESIQVVRGGQETIVLKVRGPGAARDVYIFEDEQRTQDFMDSLEKRLRSARWSFEGADAERRKGIDRRANPRHLSERRRRW